MLYSMTYGVMPSREQFDEAWDKAGIDKFRFGNDPRLGNDALSQDELWDELNLVLDEENHSDNEGSWVGDVLYALGIEWV